MQAVAARQHGVDEWGADIEAPTAGLQHPLDEVGHLGRGEDRGGELVAAAARDEDPAWVVHPDLLDGRIVEVGLQLAEARHPRDQLVDDGLGLGQRERGSRQAPGVVGGDQLLGQRSHPRRLRLRVDPVRTDGGAHARIEGLHGLDVRRPTRFEHAHQQPHPPRKGQRRATF